jgi:uncharacterized protein
MSMKKVFIIHGFQGSPNGAWRPWLMRELEKEEIYACALPMPTPDKPLQKEWVETIQHVLEGDVSEIYLVGHSLGVPAVLRYLELADKPIEGAVLISGPFEASREEIKSFYETLFDFNKIKANCKSFAVIHGDDDPNVPLEHARKFEEVLSARISIIKNGKHLNGSSGCFELPEAKEALLAMMK